MFYVYIIYSPTYNKYYKGYSTDLSYRLNQHNVGLTKSTRSFSPWVLVYAEVYEIKSKALKREKVLKKYDHAQIKKLLTINHPKRFYW